MSQRLEQQQQVQQGLERRIAELTDALHAKVGSCALHIVAAVANRLEYLSTQTTECAASLAARIDIERVLSLKCAAAESQAMESQARATETQVRESHARATQTEAILREQLQQVAVFSSTTHIYTHTFFLSLSLADCGIGSD